MQRKQLIALVAVMSMLCLMGTSLCVSTDVEAADGRTLVVETSPDFAPFDYQVGKEYAGIDMDIVRAVCNDMGCKVEFRTNTFDSILMFPLMYAIAPATELNSSPGCSSTLTNCRLSPVMVYFIVKPRCTSRSDDITDFHREPHVSILDGGFSDHVP